MNSEKTGAPGDESFVGRWSRRKLEARDDAEALQPTAEAGAGEAFSQVADDAPEVVLTDADMPDLDSLSEDASYADFLSPGVSEELRRRALRKLFHSAAFNVRDGLNDYDGDYTQFEKLGDIVTADMKHRLEMEAEKKRREALEAMDDDAAGAAGENASGPVVDEHGVVADTARPADPIDSESAADVEAADHSDQPESTNTRHDG